MCVSSMSGFGSAVHRRQEIRRSSVNSDVCYEEILIKKSSTTATIEEQLVSRLEPNFKLVLDNVL